LAQGANLIGIVIYDLPNRDCSALASNGELLIANGGSARYKTEYIDVIYSVISQPKYSGLRIVAVIEPDSLPNLVTNLSFAKCQEANGPGGYVENTQYALNKLHPVSNFYAYIDIGHAGWLGWTDNFNNSVNLIANAILGTNAGGNSIDGFISNTANTSVVTEPYLTANQTINGQPVRSADFYQWNNYIDEGAFDAAWKSAMAARGVKNGMLVDTSRNGWGGCGGGPYVSQQCRPTGPSTSTDLNTFVNQSRIDRRPAKGDWCNQNGAGIGARPQANPPDAGGVYQAFVWVKPPGESDGSSSLIPPGPENPGGKGFDQMCDPNYMGNSLNNNKNTNALPNAPVSGRWFSAQFVQLVQNAYPPIQ
jgi:cellulose 1,4-beta-cellobiosidase